jgi:glycosyltransferase involved in cell wall biosynthesis
MKLSIITINYNDAIGLKKTIDSVVQQTFTDFEYIIIDGGSIDGSLDIIKENERHIDYWVSEPDKGIYNAMNKGILAAKGEYLLFLNGGDWFSANESLDLLAENTGDYDIVFGDTYFFYSQSKIKENKLPDLITFNYLAYVNAIPHQAALIKKEFIIKNGLYDENLKIASDWKFFLLSFFKWNASYLHVPHFICFYDFGGISSTNRPLAEQEQKQIIKDDFINFTYVKEQMILVDKILFYFKYSRTIRIFKLLGMIKKIEYLKYWGF